MFKYSKLSQYKIKKILYCFSMDLTALQTAGLLKLNRNTINRYYKLFREGKVYIQIIPNSSSETLLGIVKEKIKLDSVVYTDSFRAYNHLSINGYKHYRINHSKEFARGKNHINGIENFWSYCKMRLAKFHGLKREEFLLHLKESEFRFNNRNKDLYKMMFQAITKF